MTGAHDTVVCTVVHPGVLSYFGPWLASVSAQSDQAFDLCLALDGVDARQLPKLPHAGRMVRLIESVPGRSPAEVRTALFVQVIDSHEVIVTVDADDVLMTGRLAAAKQDATRADLAACAMELIDDAGASLGRRFCVLADASSGALGRLLPRANVFGLSNATWRAGTLRGCLPVPRGVVAVDWFLATAAWLAGARLSLDDRVLMAYRQHATNIARILPPFSPAMVRSATDIVLRHQRATTGRLQRASRATAESLSRALRKTERFSAAVVPDDDLLEAYCVELNRLPPPQAWWTIVADPALEDLWRP